MLQNLVQSSQLSAINNEFSKPGVTFEAGKGGLILCALEFAGNKANVYLHGAHVTSWQGRETGEHLFLSSESCFEAGKPIRGGIPICYPQFGLLGDLPKQQHGFARTNPWQMVSSQSSSDQVGVILELDDSTGKLWPGKPTTAKLEITLNENLSMKLSVTNNGMNFIEVTNAFHTYFSVSAIDRVSVAGLEHVMFIDRLDGDKKIREVRDLIYIERETDQIYLNTPNKLEIIDLGWQRRFQIEKSNQPDAVLWNPWIEKARLMKDFGDNEYRSMVCLETGTVAKPAGIEPGDTIELGQVLSVFKFA